MNAHVEKKRAGGSHGILLSNPLSVRDLLKFRHDLELGYGLFQEITGLDLNELNRYRRQRGGAKPTISEEAAQRIARCQKALQFALEITAGDHEKAVDWLYAPSPIFDGKSPIDLAPKKNGFAKIETVILQMRALAGGTGTREPPVSKTMPARIAPPHANPATSTPGSAAHQTGGPTAPTPAPMNITPVRPTPLPVSTSAISGPKGLARARDKGAKVVGPVSAFLLQVAREPVRKTAPEITASVASTAPETSNESSSQAISPHLPGVSVKPPEATSSASLPPAPIKKSDSSDEQSDGNPIAFTQSSPIPSSLPAFSGIDPNARLFRLKPRLQPLLKQNGMSVKTLGEKLLERGLTQFKTQTLSSRIANSYTWATWREVVEIAALLSVNPHELAGTPEL